MTDTNTGVELLNIEEVKALFEGVGAPAEKLDEFVEVFNAAVTAQTNARVEVLVAEKVAELDAKTEQHTTFLNEKAEEYKVLVKEEMDVKLDSYIKHFAEEYVADNKPVIESNVKASMFSSLMGDLIKVFESHNVKLSDEGKDVLAVTESELATTKEVLAEAQAQVIELKAQINEGKKSDIMAAAVAELTESQAEKVRELAADLIYSEAYTDKVQRIVEAIATKATQVKPETTEVVTENTPVEEGLPQVSTTMQSYLNAAKGKPSAALR